MNLDSTQPSLQLQFPLSIKMYSMKLKEHPSNDLTDYFSMISKDPW